MKLHNFQNLLTEYGMTPGSPTPVSQQQTGSSAKSRSVSAPSTSPSTAPSTSPSTAPSANSQADSDQQPQALVVKADQLKKDAVFPSEKGEPVKVVSPADSVDPNIPNDAQDTVIVHNERTNKYYALDPDADIAIPQVEENVSVSFSGLTLQEQLEIVSKLDKEIIDEAWSKKYKDSINCSNPKGFSQRAHCAGKKKKASETIEAEQDMAALLTAYGTASKKKKRKKATENVKPYFLKPGELRGSWRDAELRKLGFKLASNGSWYTSQARWQELSKVGERNWRSLINERTVNENLRDWFGKGKKGGAGGGGWDRYNSKGERIGKCGDSKPGEGKPKCLSKSAAAKLRNADKDGDGKKDGKAGIARAVARKRQKDPNPNRKGKAKNVSNESVLEDTGIPFDQCPKCGGPICHVSESEGKKDACYHKVKSRYKVWPSAYASGALVQCRKVGAKNWGNKSKKKESLGESVVAEAVPNNDSVYVLKRVMSKPLLTGDIRSQMDAYIALPDPDMLLQFRLMRAEGGDNVDLRPVVKQYMQKLHPRLKSQLKV